MNNSGEPKDATNTVRDANPLQHQSQDDPEASASEKPRPDSEIWPESAEGWLAHFLG
jgi:hypothetical protein